MTKEQLNQLQQDLDFDRKEMAHLFGVSIHTMIKWLKGERQPPAIVDKFVHVLTIIRMMSPEVYNSLIAQSRRKQ